MPLAPKTHLETLQYLQGLERDRPLRGTIAAKHPERYDAVRGMLLSNRQELLGWMSDSTHFERMRKRCQGDIFGQPEKTLEFLETGLRAANGNHIREYQDRFPAGDEIYIDPQELTPEKLLRFEKWLLLQCLRFSRQIKRVLKKKAATESQIDALSSFMSRQFTGQVMVGAPKAFRTLSGTNRITLVDRAGLDLPGLRSVIQENYLDPFRYQERRLKSPPQYPKKRSA